MGEIFERPVPAQALSFSGERMTSEAHGQIEYEHTHRYLLARQFCRGKAVLDIASGEGYGSALLSQVAASVVGVEISQQAVDHATFSYSSPKLTFRKGDALAIPAENHQFDVVVSFETIEHFYEHDVFLSEVVRVLKPGGLLMISSPDRDNYSPAGRPANPFHVHELTRDEFTRALGRHFSKVALWWQRPLVGSAILPEPGANLTSESLCFETRGDKHFEASAGYPRPLYLIGLCSESDLPPLAPSLYIQCAFPDSISAHFESVISGLQGRVAELEQELSVQKDRAIHSNNAASSDFPSHSELGDQ